MKREDLRRSRSITNMHVAVNEDLNSSALTSEIDEESNEDDMNDVNEDDMNDCSFPFRSAAPSHSIWD